MSSTLDPLLEATRLLAQVWAKPIPVSVPGSSGRRQRRDRAAQARADAVHAEVAAGIARESRRELGPESLAKQQGYRGAAQLIATTSGSSTGDAARLMKVGRPRPRSNLIEELPSEVPCDA
jgi:hypothetical protein